MSAASPGPAGRAEDVAPGVRRILAPNPGLMTGPGTNTYLVGEGEVAVIDPGPDDPAHLEAILAAAGDRIRLIAATHTHVDHSPLWRSLRDATGAQVLGFGPAPSLPAHRHPPAAGHSPGSADAHDLTFHPDRRLADGDTLEVDGLRLEAVHTPGHCSNHLSFEMAGTGLLFSGDHVMSGSTVVIAPPDGDMADYLDALEKVRRRHPTRIAPGHGGMIEDASAALDYYIDHRRSREEQVLAALAGAGAGAGGEGMTAGEVVAAVYVDVPADLHPVAVYSVWAHLRKLAGEGRASGTDPDDPGAPWRAAPGPAAG